MKKLLVLVIAILMGIVLTAQENKVQKEPKSYIMLSAGPSFPAGDFASTSENNEKAGFAKTGFNIDLTYGIKIKKFFGMEARGMYGYHKLDNSLLKGTDATLDHYQYYGLMAGPAFSEGGDNVQFSVRFMAGFANTNSPKLVVNNETLMTEDWVGTFAWTTGADVKYDINKRLFVLVKAEYMEMRPEFNVTIDNERMSDKRKLFIVDVNAGIGIRF